MTRGVPGTTPDHGTSQRYVSGCHCTACRAADARRRRHTRYDAALGRPRMLPAHGTRRRLQALAALGWSYTLIGERLGVDRTAVRQLSKPHGKVLASTADRIAAVYDALSMTPGPSTITRSRALAKGWPPPLLWDDDTIDDPDAKPAVLSKRARNALGPIIDDVAIQRAIAGDRIQLNRLERLVAVERLAAKGWNDSQIAERVGTTERTVHRDRSAHGIESRWAS